VARRVKQNGDSSSTVKTKGGWGVAFKVGIGVLGN
jgi:hypothetical protein